jgi:hypothetical protein
MERLEALLFEGLEGKAVPLTDVDWSDMRRRFEERHAASCNVTPPHTLTDDLLSDQMAAILRTRTPTERLAMALRSWSFIRDLIRRTAAHQHPEWSATELSRHVAQRMSHGAV